MDRTWHGSRAAVAAWLVIAQLAAAIGPALRPGMALAEGTSSAGLVAQARTLYESARFEDAIELLAGPVDKRAFSTGDLAAAREILARSYVKLGQVVKGRNAFAGLLADDPEWRPDPDQVPPDEIAVFNEALADFQRKAGISPSKPAASRPDAQQPGPSGALPPGQGTDAGAHRSWWKKPWAIAGMLLAGVGIAVLAGGGGSDGGNAGNPDLGLPPPPPPVIGQQGR